jgi:hypothetical protein
MQVIVVCPHEHEFKMSEKISRMRRQIAKAQADGDLSNFASGNNELGRLYRSLGHFDSSLECHDIELKTCLRLGDAVGYATAIRNIGEVYR